MTDREIVAYNPDTEPDSLVTPQVADRYLAKRAIHLEQPLTTDSTIDGVDVAAVGAKVAHITVTQAVNLDTIESRIDALTAVVVLKGVWDASTGFFPVSVLAGESWICTVPGTVAGVAFAVNDRLIAIVDAPSTVVYTNEWLKQAYSDAVLTVAGRTGTIVLTEADISDLQAYLLEADIDTLAKLNAILTDATLGDETDFATAAQGVLAATALQPTSIDTLAKLNAIVTDATLIDTVDARLSDARTPLAHTHVDIVTTGLTAFAGGGQASAVQLDQQVNVLTTVATNGDSAKLPAASEGRVVTVVNKGAKYANIFPAVDDSIDMLAVNTAIILLPNSAVTLQALDSIIWKVLSPQGTGWRDLEMVVTGAASGPAAPTLSVFGPTGTIKQLAFAVNDSVYLAGHVPHDVKPGSTMYVHVHWTTNGTSANTVKWQINWTAAKGHNQESFPADTVLTLEQAGQGTAWRHMIIEDVTGILMLEIDSLFILELKRITNGATENADTVFGLFVDIHYESHQFATPNRTPDFYT